MNDKEILASANDAIVEKPFEFKVEVNPKNWYHKLLIRLKIRPKVLNLTIKPTVLGARIWYSKSLLGVGVSDQDLERPESMVNHEATLNHTLKIANAIASAIHNKNSEPPKWLVDAILDNFSSEDLMNVTQVLKGFINSKDFLHSIILLTGMSLNEKEEIIASTPTSGK